MKAARYAPAATRRICLTKPLPETREKLLELHREARRRRAAARLGGKKYRAAAEEIAAIEIRISEIERRHLPPPKS